jgi:transposase
MDQTQVGIPYVTGLHGTVRCASQRPGIDRGLSTGVYWIPAFQVLEQRGLEVKLVNAAHVKNLPGRKSDVSDCQWLQQLHSFGLLNGSFRPKDGVCVLRSFLRLRDTLVKDSSSHVLRMQKALTEMNIQVHRVITDITGYSGMAIIRAILNGERNALKLAQMKHLWSKRLPK